MKIITIMIVLIFNTSIVFAQSKNTDISKVLPTLPAFGLPTTLPTPMDTNGLYQQPKIFNEKPKDPSLNFQDIPIGQLLNLIFQEIDNHSYVLSPDISKDERLVSFRYSSKTDGDLLIFTTNLLNTLGYQLKIINKVYFVSKKDDVKDVKFISNDFIDIYKPKYRDSNYLLNLVRPLFPDSFVSISRIRNDGMTGSSNGSYNPDSAPAQIDSKVDRIVFHAEDKKTLDKINIILNKLDTKEDDLLVKAYIYEVNYSNADGSALGLILNLANKKLTSTLGSDKPLTNIVSFTTAGITLLFSNIDTDNRFKLLSNPYMRIKNGKTATLNVGASVPTLGAITYQQSQSVQSVDYKDSGLVFKITPTIKENVIDFYLNTSISEVQNTTTGVNNTPTLTKRELDNTFTTTKNETILLAGLSHNKTSNSTSRPFFLPFLTNKNSSKDNTEIIIFLEIVPVENNKLPDVIADSLEQHPL